jgi:hypothetical protein
MSLSKRVNYIDRPIYLFRYLWFVNKTLSFSTTEHTMLQNPVLWGMKSCSLLDKYIDA